MAKHKGPRKPPGQKKPPLTHFLCLPLVTSTSRPQLEASLKTFKDDVSSRGTIVNEDLETAEQNATLGQEAVLPAVRRKAIRPVGALHCTLGVMSLDKDKLSDATKFLQRLDIRALFKDTLNNSNEPSESSSVKDGPSAPASLERSITPPKVERAADPLKVNLKGLVSMHSPQNTSILYVAPEDSTGKLYPFCVALQKEFKDKGFLVEDNRQLKIHATIVNTIYAKEKQRPPRSNAKPQISEPQAQHPTTSGAPDGQSGRSDGHGPNANAPLKIDATAILEKYKDFVWVEGVVLDRVAICEMGAKKFMDDEGNVKDEEYTEVATIALPR